MIVHTHLEITSAFPFLDVLRLLELWKTAWALQGFIPVVTDRSFLERNAESPTAKRFLKKVADFPSINAQGFDRASFHRWLAAYLICQKSGASIVSTESDVLNHGLKRDSLRTFEVDYLHIGDRDCCPAFAYGNELAFFHLVDSISRHSVTDIDNYEGKPHLSDQDYIYRYFRKHRVYRSCIELIASVFRTPNWEGFPLVHYGNPFMGEAGINVQEIPKVDTVLKLELVEKTNPAMADLIKEIHGKPNEFFQEMCLIINREAHLNRLNSSKWVALGRRLRLC